MTATAELDRRRKAAIIVRALLEQDGLPPLVGLPEDTQADLARELAALRLVDRATLHAVAAEFADHLEGLGIAAPGGLDSALGALGGRISPGVAARLKAEEARRRGADPWAALAALPAAPLARALEAESVEVAAVALSKLPVALAAEVLGLLPGERARRVAFAVSRTGGVGADAVRRIGEALAGALCEVAPPAFPKPAGERVGAILNAAGARRREEVLGALASEDEGFAAEVRRAIFTFAHVPARLKATDVPRVLRVVETRAIAAALLHAEAQGGAEAEAGAFVLGSVSQRMAESLREEMREMGPLRKGEGEAAQAALVAAIRDRVEAGEVQLNEVEE